MLAPRQSDVAVYASLLAQLGAHPSVDKVRAGYVAAFGTEPKVDGFGNFACAGCTHCHGCVACAGCAFCFGCLACAGCALCVGCVACAGVALSAATALATVCTGKVLSFGSFTKYTLFSFRSRSGVAAERAPLVRAAAPRQPGARTLDSVLSRV